MTTIGSDKKPSWSPNGREIAFIRNETNLCVKNLDSGATRVLVKVREAAIAWQPTKRSRWIAFVEQGNEKDQRYISFVHADTRASMRLFKCGLVEPSYRRELAFSPSGRRLAYSTAMEIRFIEVPPKSVEEVDSDRSITGRLKDCAGFSWLDEQQLFVITRGRRYGERAGAIFDIGTGDRATVSGLRDYPSAPRIGRIDGKPVIVYSDSPVATTFAMQPSKQDGSFDSNKDFALFRTKRSNLNPRFSPDGRSIVFGSNRTGGWRIYVGEVANSHLAQEISGDNCGSPRWSPDGAKIVIDHSGPRGRDLHVIDIATRKSEPLTISETRDVRPSWARDGKSILFGRQRRDRSEPFQIWRKPYPDGPASQLTRDGGFEAHEGPNGDVYFTKQRVPGLWRIAPETGKAELIVDTPTQGRWTIRGDSIYFVDLEGKKAVMRMVLDGGELTHVGTARMDPGGEAVGFDVHPERGCLVLRHVKSTSDIFIQGFQE